MPNSKRRFVAAVSLLLALLLLLSGCSAAVPVPAPERTPAPTPAAAPTATPAPLPTPEPPAREAMVQFSAISYQRPDLEETLDTLSGCLAALSGCTAPEALDAAKRADACYDAFATMETVAQIRSSMDKSVAYWAEEEALLSSWSPQVEEAYEAVYRALKDGPHRAALEESQGPTFFRKISPIDSFTEVTVPLFEQENELMNRYDTIRYTGTVPVEGKDYTLDELYGMEDRAVRKEAYDRWEESHGKALEELYLELIKLRNRIARELGFENYPEYVYAVEERPYTVDMTLALISDIRSTLAPAYARYCENTSLYPDRADLPLEAFLPALETILEDMDPKLAQSFSAMQEYGLCDLEYRPFKETGAYTTYLQSYHVPYVVSSYFNDGDSMTTIVHEFGHFHNFFHVEDAVYDAPLDTAEIFSQALELMVMPQYREFLPEDVAYELYCNLLDACFDILVYQSYIAAMELNMYALAEDELTVENLERIAMEQAVAFCLVEPEEQESQKRSWVQILHMFVVPLYTFSYATSMDVSLQIWERYLEDPGAAMEAYHQMMLQEDQTAYFENLEAAGLSSPFAPGRMQKLTELLERYLVEEELEDVFFEE